MRQRAELCGSSGLQEVWKTEASSNKRCTKDEVRGKKLSFRVFPEQLPRLSEQRFFLCCYLTACSVMFT